MQNSQTPKHLQHYSMEWQNAPLNSKRLMCTEAFCIWNSVKSWNGEKHLPRSYYAETVLLVSTYSHWDSYLSPRLSDQYIICDKVLWFAGIKYTKTCQVLPFPNPVQTHSKMLMLLIYDVLGINMLSKAFSNCWAGPLTTLPICKTKEMPAVMWMW